MTEFFISKPELAENDIELNFPDSPTDSPRNISSRSKIKSFNFSQQPTENLLDSIDLNSSDLANDDIMREINLNYSRISDSFLHISQKYSFRIEKIEKDTQNKITEYETMLSLELEKLNEFKPKTATTTELSTTDRLKHYARRTILSPFLKDSYSPNSLSPSASNSNLDLNNSELGILLNACRQKYVRMMMSTYLVSFKDIYKLKKESIEPLFNKLESLIEETHQNRIKLLRSINEKEISNINKSTHEEIKLKKKNMTQSFYENNTEQQR